jgi:ApbE superfamily uncharacterized protein (UPF0280 family)
MNATTQQGARRFPTYQCAMLSDGRLHLNEGPIDLVIGAEGAAASIRAAYAKATRRFDGLLSELVSELPALRTPITETGPTLRNPVARRMLSAAKPHRATFITPMAAVAGAVADEILAAMTSTPGLSKAYVNNGGDIAIHLAAGETLTIGAVSSLSAAVPDGFVTLRDTDGVRGIATSGAEGRSFSLGIADSVTVLARTAAQADVAATLIGNAVDVDHAAITRAPATSLDPDSDLGNQPVTINVGVLPFETISLALDRGATVANEMLRTNLISGGLLRLGNQVRPVGRSTILRDLSKE